jgi:circadian clock protein KaiC
MLERDAMSTSDAKNRARITDNVVQNDTLVESGVPHLDRILGGGFPEGSLILIVGMPGSGKTTMASQIALHAARRGKTALVLTALSESTNKLIEHLRGFSFFDQGLIGGPLQFLSLQATLSQGLQATSEVIVAEARRAEADIVVLDGFRGIGVERDSQAAREFLYSVGTTLSALGATMVITSEIDPRDPAFFPEATTADVIIGLYYQLKGVRQFRGIEIIKARAAEPLPGLHALTLGVNGAHVYPQLEERVAAEVMGADAQTQGAAHLINRRYEAQRPDRRAGFGIPEFDMMLRGGLPERTATLLAGSLGTGKTLLAIYYAIAGVRAGERVVYLGFRETREQLIQAAAPFEFGAELVQALEPDGGLTFIERPPIKLNADILADRLLDAIDSAGAQRLVIDSIAEIEQAILRSLDPERLADYLAALLSAVRSRSVTALFIKETDKALTTSLDLSADALSILAECMILLQHIPYEGSLRRILSILKLRFSDPDAALREFRIAAPAGLQMLPPFMRAPTGPMDINDQQTARFRPGAGGPVSTSEEER